MATSISGGLPLIILTMASFSDPSQAQAGNCQDPCSMSPCCAGCPAAGVCPCSAAMCNDQNSCTVDSCSGDECIHDPLSNIPCDDHLICTDPDECQNGVCVGTPVECPDDGEECTEHVCVEAKGGCLTLYLSNIACNDDDECTTGDHCLVGACVGDPVHRYDANLCTDDACYTDVGCVFTPNDDNECTDYDDCTADECIGGQCVGFPVPCVPPTCQANYVVDGEGGEEGVPIDNTWNVTIPQGTSCVRVVVYLFSREWPIYTGSQSIWNDGLSYEVDAATGQNWSDTVTVNSLDDVFHAGPLPGGNYTALDVVIDYSELTAQQASTLTLYGSATNVSDSLLGSGVAFCVENLTVDLNVDSNNDGQITVVGDNFEDDPALPGKYVCVNDDDDDGDAVPDLSDGFNADGVGGNADDLNTAENDFVPVLFEVAAPIDLGVALIQVTSLAAVRIWRKDGNLARNAASISAGGDQVTNGIHAPGAFGLSNAMRSVQLWVEGLAPSASLGDSRIVFEVDPDGPGPSGFDCDDAIRVSALQVDFDIDSDNTNNVPDFGPQLNAAEDAMEDDPTKPGKYVRVNDDDDDDDGVPDASDGYNRDGMAGNADDLNAAENDFVRVVLELPAPTNLAVATIKVTRPVALRVWKKNGNVARNIASISAGGDQVTSATHAATAFGLSNVMRSVNLWLEGTIPSDALGASRMTFEVDPDGPGPAGFQCFDAARVTVAKVDLDVDSDNTNNVADFGPNRTSAEDNIEDRGNLPGRFVCLNEDDDDNDNIADLGDGYDLDGAGGGMEDDINVSEADFVRMVFEAPQPLDLAVATIRVTYTASNPAATVPTGDCPDIAAPPDGRLRIWTKNGNVVRNMNPATGMPGDYVAQATYGAANLGLTNQNRTVNLWLEGIKPSPSLGADRILFEIDPDGPGNADFLHADAVRVTIVQVTLTATPDAYLPQNSNMVSFTAEILPAALTDDIRFELVDVSDFPGDAMNHGMQGDLDPDFKFEAAGNPTLIVAGNQLSATTQAPANIATAQVTAFDYGAVAKIRAVLVGRGCVSLKRNLPKDSDCDRLPDAYENLQPDIDHDKADTDMDGVKDAEEDDDPERPVVADAGPHLVPASTSVLGLVGDGLVAFEEYRGFFITMAHTRTTTRTKDVFANVDPLVPVGLGFFPNLAGFDVRRINDMEWDGIANRYINWQRSGIAGATDQRALRVINNVLGGGVLGNTNPLPGMPYNQSPNEIDFIEINVAAHPAGMPGQAAGPDAMLCTADDIAVALTAGEAMDALRETVAHECGHGCHVEHNFCTGDEYVIPITHGAPHSINVTTGPDGICNTGAGGDDVPIIMIGQGFPGAVAIIDGGDGLQTLPAGDDMIVGSTITTGPDGVAQTAAAGNDVQLIMPGNGQPHTDCIDTGADGVSNTPAVGDDVPRIAVGQGEPHQVGITDGGDRVINAMPGGDDAIVGLTVTTGANGIQETVTWVDNQGNISNMTSDVLVPVPSMYSVDDLDQVRFHMKHP